MKRRTLARIQIAALFISLFPWQQVWSAITTDLTNFPTWTTDRTEAGGEA